MPMTWGAKGHRERTRRAARHRQHNRYPQGTVRVVLGNDYTGPGSGLGDGGSRATLASSSNSGSDKSDAPPALADFDRGLRPSGVRQLIY